MPARLGVSWELLSRDSRRLLRGQLRMILLGLAGPLALCLYTLLRPFDLRQGYHNLQQYAIWLAAWYVAFPELYALLHWARPAAAREGADTRHLPLSQLHFFLKRAAELCLVPLCCAALTLPLWLAVLLYTGVPYGEQWSNPSWSFTLGDELYTLWPARVAMVALVLAGATLLPLALALVIDETVFFMPARAALLLGATAGMYFAVRRLEYTYFRMCYRQTRGYDVLSFLAPIALWLLFVLAVGLLTPRWRLALGIASFAAVALFFTWPHLRPEPFPLSPTPPYALEFHDARMALSYCAGHLSPVKNVRLAFDSLDSNVLLAPHGTPREPQYPDSSEYGGDDAKYQVAYQAYQRAEDAYQQAYSALPRIAMWVGAGLYPLLLPLLAFAGLTLGFARRRDPPREQL